VDEDQLDGADIDWEYPDAGKSSQNFLALIRELRAALPNKLLTAAVVSYGDHGLGIPPESFDLLDFVNVMTYDGPDHGTMEQFEKGIAYWSERGVPREKLIIGVPFYSHVKNSSAEGMTYSKLVKADPAAAQVDEFDVYGMTQVYNGIPTIQEKTRLAMQETAGIMFWALDHDTQGDLSLVNAIYQTAHSSP
jgi:GH18 family chitinase